MISLAFVLGPAVASLGLSFRRVRTRAPALLAAISLAISVLAGVQVFSPSFSIPVSLAGHLRVDPTSRLFLALINPIFFGVAVYVWNRVSATPALGGGTGRYVGLALTFLAASNAVLIANHLVVLWIALEVTALAAAPLIINQDAPSSRLASWHYFLFSTVGLGLVMLGLTCLERGLEAGGATPTFFLDRLEPIAAASANRWGELGLALVILGFGTKLGLAPMYSWLPEAYDGCAPGRDGPPRRSSIQRGSGRTDARGPRLPPRPSRADCLRAIDHGARLDGGLHPQHHRDPQHEASHRLRLHQPRRRDRNRARHRQDRVLWALAVRHQQRLHQSDPFLDRGEDQDALRDQRHPPDRRPSRGLALQRRVLDGRHVRPARLPTIRQLLRRAPDPLGARRLGSHVRVRGFLRADHDDLRGDREDDLSDDLGRAPAAPDVAAADLSVGAPQDVLPGRAGGPWRLHSPGRQRSRPAGRRTPSRDRELVRPGSPGPGRAPSLCSGPRNGGTTSSAGTGRVRGC